jgi:hypothetical protein
VIIDDARGELIPARAAASIDLSGSKKGTPPKVSASTVYYRHQLPALGSGAIFLPARTVEIWNNER